MSSTPNHSGRLASPPARRKGTARIVASTLLALALALTTGLMPAIGSTASQSTVAPAFEAVSLHHHHHRRHHHHHHRHHSSASHRRAVRAARAAHAARVAHAAAVAHAAQIAHAAAAAQAVLLPRALKPADHRAPAGNKTASTPPATKIPVPVTPPVPPTTTVPPVPPVPPVLPAPPATAPAPRATAPAPPATAPAPPATAPPLPAGAVLVPVGSSLQDAVDAHATGTTFLLAAGVHRLDAVQPKAGDAFVGESGAVLDGSRLLSTFASEGGIWYAAGQTQQGFVHGECNSAHPLCASPDVVFLDGRLATPVASKAALVPGSYFFDHSADRIWLGSDPRASVVEAAVADRAFHGTASGVTVRDLTVQKYATPAQRGAVDATDGTGWVIQRVVARLNHGGGLRAGNGTHILDSHAVDNGQIGITGMGRDILVEGTEIARNNTAGYAAGWEAGGTKFALTTGLTVAGNNVHDNHGPGLWTDIDNIGTLYDGNVVTDNDGDGIFHEISYAAVIRNNVVKGNGLSFHAWVWGAGIQVASSRDVQVYGNDVEGNGNGIVGSQQNRGTGAYGLRVTINLDVHDNKVVNSGQVGIGQDVRDTSIFTTKGNRFHHNAYRNNQVFTWLDRNSMGEGWRSSGEDADGTWS